MGLSLWTFSLFIPLLFAPCQRVLRGCFLACVMAFYVLICFKAPLLPEQGIEGRGLLHICDQAKVTRPFGTDTVLKCQLRRFEGEKVVVERVNVKVLLKEAPQAGEALAQRNWWVKGKLRGNAYRGYTFKPTQWQEAQKTVSLAPLRAKWRLKLRDFFRNCFKEKRLADFISGMITGEFVDADLFFSFTRLGLQHLMAISGFHFSLVAGLVAKILGACLSPRRASVAALSVLSLYFILLWPGAAVVRAFLMAFVHYFGLMCGRRVDPFNALGVALAILLLIDPFAILSMGCHYSFGCTAALLLFYSPIDRFLARFLGRHGRKEVLNMGVMDQHGFAFLALLRQGVAMMFAVNLVVIPLTLFHFGQFSWLSLLYNLFFPSLVAFTMSVGIPLLLVPWGNVLLERLVAWTLDFARYVPAVLEGQWRVEQMPLWMISGYFLLILLGWTFMVRMNEQKRRALLPNGS
ncbi:MAG: ComEC/Rec2 family competence protein [Verrucomicrobia bacterium]|nr:ComEC/Rec2 family competence protein [Verrucomicrobiota bacterium]